MKYKFAQIMITTTIFAGVMMQPASTFAFWPFDGGQVKGVQAENSSGFMGMVQRMFKPGVVLPTTSIPLRDDASQGASGLSTSIPNTVLGIPNPKARLDQAVKEGKLTQAQATEILAQLDAIKMKQDELMKLQTALATWMKANNLSSAIFNTPRPMPPQGAGYGRPTGASGMNQQYYMRKPPQGGGQTEPGSAPSNQ